MKRAGGRGGDGSGRGGSRGRGYKSGGTDKAGINHSRTSDRSTQNSTLWSSPS